MLCHIEIVGVRPRKNEARRARSRSRPSPKPSVPKRNASVRPKCWKRS